MSLEGDLEGISAATDEEWQKETNSDGRFQASSESEHSSLAG